MSNFILYTRYTTPENLVEIIEGKEHASELISAFMAGCRRLFKTDHQFVNSMMKSNDQKTNDSSSWSLTGLTIDATVWDQIPSLQLSRKK